LVSQKGGIPSEKGYLVVGSGHSEIGYLITYEESSVPWVVYPSTCTSEIGYLASPKGAATSKAVYLGACSGHLVPAVGHSVSCKVSPLS
jgi:hypothetical protein